MAKLVGGMPQFKGRPAVNQHERLLSHCMIMTAATAAIAGACIASFIPLEALSRQTRLLVLAIVALINLWALTKWGEKRLAVLEKERRDLRQNASGELQVQFVLADFPDRFYVLSNLATPCGKIEHLVIGPTGVFILETKTWRGIVAPDGNGELLVNGQRPAQNLIGPMVKRMQDIRNRVQAMAPAPDPLYNAVLVFTAASVDARWDSTGAVDCIREDQLYDHIVQKKTDKPLRADEIKELAHAFMGLAADSGLSPEDKFLETPSPGKTLGMERDAMFPSV